MAIDIVLRHVEDHSQVQIAVRAVISARPRAKHNDLQRVRSRDDAPHHLVHLIRSHRPIMRSKLPDHTVAPVSIYLEF